ncbi:UDP-N-acetylmuramate--L-alanine ligase [Spirochaeta dissipatitropha]
MSHTSSVNSALQAYSGRKIHCVGIKGSGMAALCELLAAAGAVISGSDVTEPFFTDALLARIGITPCPGFSAEHVPQDCDLVVYSAAYSPESNPELVEAVRRGIKCLEYPEALGELSRSWPGLAVAGTHGKTTTTGMLALAIRELGLPGGAILGSLVPALDNHASFAAGDRFLAAETCEYRRHFLHFHPRWAIVTNVEADHLDYFRDEQDVREAFVSFCNRIYIGGTLVYCADDPGATAVARQVAAGRPDIQLIPYGFNCAGPYQITLHSPGFFSMAGVNAEIRLQVPGRHSVLNAVAVYAVLQAVVEDLDLPAIEDSRLAEALASFTGTRRRSEIIAEKNGILVMDDYGHHPTEIRLTIEGIREHYPDKRIVVDFMHHTFSRTERLWNDFLHCFESADELWMHPVFSSAREGAGRDPLETGKQFADELSGKTRIPVRFFESFHETVSHAAANLRSGDLLLTMGAGNNYEIGTALVEAL